MTRKTFMKQWFRNCSTARKFISTYIGALIAILVVGWVTGEACLPGSNNCDIDWSATGQFISGIALVFTPIAAFAALGSWKKEQIANRQHDAALKMISIVTEARVVIMRALLYEAITEIPPLYSIEETENHFDANTLEYDQWNTHARSALSFIKTIKDTPDLWIKFFVVMSEARTVLGDDAGNKMKELEEFRNNLFVNAKRLNRTFENRMAGDDYDAKEFSEIAKNFPYNVETKNGSLREDIETHIDPEHRHTVDKIASDCEEIARNFLRAKAKA